MGTNLSPNWSSREPKTITVVNQTQRPNAVVRHNSPAMLTVANSGQSYQPDMIRPVDPQRNERFIDERANFHASATGSPPQRPLIPPPQSTPPPLPQSQLTLQPKKLMGEVDKYYVLRVQHVPGDGRCVEFAVDTILHEFGIPLTKPEELKPKRSDQGRDLDEIIDIMRKKGLKSKPYEVENFVDKRITGIDNEKTFMIVEHICLDLFHTVPLVRPDKRKDFQPTKYFHESDSDDQNKSKSKRYSGNTAQDALLDYETQNNITACAVLTFREIVSADGPGWMYNKGCALIDRSLWKEAIEAFDEVITGLREAKEPKQLVLFAKALYCKGLALYKSGFLKRAVEAYNEVITFGEETEPALPALHKIVVKARDNRKVALDKQSDHSDDDQAGE